MTDNHISNIRDRSNEFYANLLNEPDKSGTYINRATWKEELFNDEFEFKEFENEEFENETFNNLIEERSFLEGIMDIVKGQASSHMSLKISGLRDDKYHRFRISSMYDVLSDIYLEIELDTTLDKILIKETYAILNSTIDITFGGHTLDTLKIINCLCNQILYGNNIKEDGNIIQVPLYNFETFVENKYGMKGLPLLSETVIRLEMHDSIKHFKYKIIANGCVYAFEKNRHLGKSDLTYIIMQNQTRCNQHPVNNNTNIYKMDFCKIVKYILIYFMPNEDVDFWQMNENYPLINKAILYHNGKQSLEFENEDLLELEIFGIKIYLLPLCKEFSSFENIHETLKNPLKKLSSSGIKFGSAHIKIEFQNNASESYTVNFVGVSLNCVRRCKGNVIIGEE